VSLAGEGSMTPHDSGPGAGKATPGLLGLMSLAQLRRQATTMARRALGPSFRRLERRAAIGVARAGEAASTWMHVTADHLERLAASSPRASRILSAARPGESATSAAAAVHPSIEGPLLAWVLERLSAAASGQARAVPALVLHAECGDGRVVEALAALGLDARGADPDAPVRADANARIVAAGTLEFLGATLSGTFDGILLTGVVDRLRPGGGRALAQLAARCLSPGGVVVLVSTRPEVVVAIDPVAADLAHGRPLHPVTWCHLLARYGLSVLATFEPDASEPDVFAVSAQRLVPALLAGKDRA
jgi:hypothetical protein